MPKVFATSHLLALMQISSPISRYLPLTFLIKRDVISQILIIVSVVYYIQAIQFRLFA